MLRDASHQQVIQKFSFIESLNLSRHKKNQFSHDHLFAEEIVKFHHRKSQVSKTEGTRSRVPEASALSTAIAEPMGTSEIVPHKNGYSDNLSLTRLDPAESYNSHNQVRLNNLSKILFVLASSYCLFALWWLFGHHSSRLFIALTGGQQIVLSQSEVQFLDYMNRSLEKIDSKRAQTKAQDSQVIYVPVYTPAPRPMPSAPTHQNSLASLPSHNPTNSLPPVPEAKPVEPIKIPAPPPLPAATPIAQEPLKVAEVNKPVIQHTLVGILELGAGKSAALVKVKGRTKRVWLGEAINSEGWILKSVGNQQAQISHQGQTRSIAVGENF